MLRERLKSELLFFEGGMGTQLQAAGLPAGELPERWNLTHPEAVQRVHAAYLSAGWRRSVIFRLKRRWRCLPKWWRQARSLRISC